MTANPEHPDEYAGQPDHYEYTLKLEYSLQQYQRLERCAQSHYTTIPCLFKRFTKLMLDLIDFGHQPGAEIILRLPGRPDRSLIFYL